MTAAAAAVAAAFVVMGVFVTMAMLMVMMVMIVEMMIVHSQILLFGFSLLYRYRLSMSKHFFFPNIPRWGLHCLPKTGIIQKITKEVDAMGDLHEHTHTWSHAHGAAHSHGHVHENQKAVINRLSRAIGHLEKVKRMVEEGHDCTEVLVQLAAVRSALDNTGKVILKDHMRHCMVDAVSAGDTDAIDDLCSAIDKFMK